MLDVVPLWFWVAFLVATLAMGRTMVQRRRILRAIQGAARPTAFDAFFMVVSRIWLPAVAVAIPGVYVLGMLFF